MSSDDRTYDTVASGEVAIDATGDQFTWTPATPVELIRVGVTGTTTYDSTTGAIIALDINASDGDGTYTRGDGDGGVITVDASFGPGLVNYLDMVSRVRLKPGDQLIAQVTQASTAGDGVVWIEYRKLPFQSGSSAAADDLLVNATEV